VAHFSAQDLPFPVRAFWSLTLSDSHGFFAPNRAGIYLVNDRFRRGRRARAFAARNNRARGRPRYVFASTASGISMSRLRILPVPPFGSSSISQMTRGYLYAATFCFM
jgi:hypothetical protein